MQIGVQFSDSTDTTIIQVFQVVTLPDLPNVAFIDTSDARYATFYDSMPTFISMALPSPPST